MSEDFQAPETPKKDTRMLALGLSVAAAVCMIYAGFTHRWLANGNKHMEYGFGLRNNFECATTFEPSDFQMGEPAPDAKPTEECTTRSNAEVVSDFEELEKTTHEKLASSAFVPAGWVTLVAILLSSLGLLAAAALAWRTIAKDLPVAPTTIALLGGMVGLISGCVFVATKPGPPGMVGVGLSFWMFGVGVVMGIVGAQMLAKVIRPPDPEWTE